MAAQHGQAGRATRLAEVGPAAVDAVVADLGAPGRIGREEVDEQVDDGRLEGIGRLGQAVGTERLRVEGDRQRTRDIGCGAAE